MKYFYIFVLFCFTFETSFSHDFETQKGKEPPVILGSVDHISSVILYSTSGIDSRWSYTYDANGKILTNLREQATDSVWVTSGRTIYTYDTKGNLLSFSNDRYQNNQWNNYYRGSYTYDDSSNQLSTLVEQWLDSQWVNYYHYTFTYHTKGKMLTGIYKIYSNGQLMITAKNTYTYDSSDNILTYLYENWQNDSLMTSLKYTYTYDANGNLLTNVYETLQNGQLENKFRYTYTYDSKGKELTSLYDLWQNGQWANSERDTYTNDSLGNQINSLTEDYIKGLWVNSLKSTNTFDSYGNQLTSFVMTWDTVGVQWVNDYQVTHVYYDSTKPLTILTETWLNEQWVKYNKTTVLYDDAGNVTNYEYDRWQDSVLVDGCERYTYTYNSSENLHSELYESTVGPIWEQTNTTMTLSDSSNNNFSFQNAFKIVITYQSEVGVNDEQSVSSSLNCFPNPASVLSKINYTVTEPETLSMTLTNSRGVESARIFENKFHAPGNYSIDYNTGNLPPGVYFLTIKAGKKIEIKKFVIIR